MRAIYINLSRHGYEEPGASTRVTPSGPSAASARARFISVSSKLSEESASVVFTKHASVRCSGSRGACVTPRWLELSSNGFSKMSEIDSFVAVLSHRRIRHQVSPNLHHSAERPSL
eukprot:GEMP01100681.1.p2 GENE.GEMP01100681.1~~GEMP01100681.1.p2  ORF type:complete len:116 (-),score=24.38 GEMP01100681.1:342-689(-)